MTSIRASSCCFASIISVLSCVAHSQTPPSGYMGIELTKSTEAQLFSTFLPADKTDIRSEVDDAGYCYHSNNGIYSAFTLGPGKRVRTIEISNRPLAASCKQIDAEFSTCLKNICLGQTRSKVENSAGKAFTSVDYPPNSDLEVIFYNHVLPLDRGGPSKSDSGISGL